MRGMSPTMEFLCRERTVNSVNEFMEGFLVKYINPNKYLILNSDTSSQDEMQHK